MRPQSGPAGFEFLFTAVPEPVDYYVEAAGVRSKQYRLNVVDLPAIKKLSVTYHYPAWTGLKNTVEDPGGDLRAVEGTEAEVKIETDRPLSNGSLLLDNGLKFDVRDGVARVPMQKDGLYHIATNEHGEVVRLSNDYFIEVQKVQPPNIRIVRPGRDARVNPIEEVTIAAEAQDDFGLRGIDLHYSVNGSPEKTIALGGANEKNAQASTTLYLENFKLVPGDIVAFYAAARNALTTSRSDIYFIEAQPFERQYTQSQQMGGEGQGGDSTAASERQKEIIAATWNQIKNTTKNNASEQENAKLLGDIQAKLRDQAKSLAQRMHSRELTGNNPAFKKFAEDMGQAIEAMGQAEPKLRGREWQAALAPEQKSLQYLSRAEATFRDITVAFGKNGGGAGGAGRDLQGLVELELDRQKNQFETGRNSASPDQRQKEIEEALAKLKELAQRQQELAQQKPQSQQAYQQRWQQELLRREAEELRRKMEELSRSQSSAQGQQEQQGQQGQQGHQGQQGQQGQQGRGSQQARDHQGLAAPRSPQPQQQAAQLAAINRAMQRLAEAMRDMQSAGSPQNQGTPQSEAEARRAAERLRESREMLAGVRKQQAGEAMNELAQKTQQLAEQQRTFENQMRQALGSGELDSQGRPSLLQPGASRRQSEQLSAEQQKLLGQLTDLERDIQKTAGDLAGSQPSQARKLRDALGDMQKQELRLKMKWSMEVLRRGMGAYAMTRQPSITQGLNELRDKVGAAQSAFARQQQAGGGKDIESALARAEQLRQQLEQLKNGSKGQQGKGQQGQGQRQQTGQNGGGQSPGEQPGLAPQSSHESEPGSQQGGAAGDGSNGSRSAGPGNVKTSGIESGGSMDPGNAGRIMRDGVRNLNELGQMLRADPDVPHEISRDVQDLLREMQQVDPKSLNGASAERIDQILGQLVARAEQIELELRRIADKQQNGSVRSGASQPLPPGYADSVAEYFRRLAKQK